MLGTKEQRTEGMKRQAQELIEQAYDRGYKAGKEQANAIIQTGIQHNPYRLMYLHMKWPYRNIHRMRIPLRDVVVNIRYLQTVTMIWNMIHCHMSIHRL